jgi:hypothetical protein
MEHHAGSPQGFVKATLLALVLCATLAGAALGAAGRLPGGPVAKAVNTAVSAAAGTLTPALKAFRGPRASREHTI